MVGYFLVFKTLIVGLSFKEVNRKKKERQRHFQIKPKYNRLGGDMIVRCFSFQMIAKYVASTQTKYDISGQTLLHQAAGQKQQRIASKLILDGLVSKWSKKEREKNRVYLFIRETVYLFRNIVIE